MEKLGTYLKKDNKRFNHMDLCWLFLIYITFRLVQISITNLTYYFFCNFGGWGQMWSLPITIACPVTFLNRFNKRVHYFKPTEATGASWKVGLICDTH